MQLFPFGHATHPQWQMAAGLVLAQLRAQMTLHGYAASPTLGLLYITDHYAAHAQEILDHLGAELPTVTDWSGTVGVGIASSNVEYFDEPALAVMLCAVPSDQYRVFSGVSPLPATFRPHTALVHADSGTPELAELITEMSDRTATGYLFGGLASSRSEAVQFAIGGNGNLSGHGKAGGVFSGGLSGVAFAEGVQLVSRVTQGCQPVAPARSITGADGNLITELDGEPALDVLLEDLDLTLEEPEAAIAALRKTLVGLTQASEDVVNRTGHFGTDVVVRHIIGLDPRRRGVAIADRVEEGMKLAFCRRDVEAARADLVRICAEIREELEPEELPLAVAAALASSEAANEPNPARRIAGAVYVSCAGRGGPHFGGPSAELQVVRRALGDVPLVGFFAGGEIARRHLYGYTGVLTVFT
ncbi:FIST C-terminal domain-containing protein [Ramlibacter sp. USB13]|uniref:FIST C-terminal domain-containing protein n=1 Tax=Ramlibacter cellulosilyticus TaxID=2764187 RepID=A0A923SB46_9BURK|nr:FIST C-terminal domain-containing protein [Ramlibacter cellulosilyticus]MBC5782878.1 FIST C-terminal domain-containing protein [Ramlibacter cellulosilyticus]